MRRVAAALWTGAAAGTALFGAGCRRDATDNAEHAAAMVRTRGTRVETALASAGGRVDAANFLSAPVARWVLPGSLSEISGLTVTPDGRLLAHDDEQSNVYEIDYHRGVLTKIFTLGDRAERGDFEAIANAEGHVYLLTSQGKLYEAREGRNGERVPFTMHNTGLGDECEMEGMTWDPSLRSLVIACKHLQRKKLQHADAIILVRIPLPGTDGERKYIEISKDELSQQLGGEAFHPSDIARDPRTGNYVMVAGIEREIAEVTPDGRVVWARPLPHGGHAQPEGVAVTKDGAIIVSDEGRGRPPVITVYPSPDHP